MGLHRSRSGICAPHFLARVLHGRRRDRRRGYACGRRTPTRLSGTVHLHAHTTYIGTVKRWYFKPAAEPTQRSCGMEHCITDHTKPVDGLFPKSPLGSRRRVLRSYPVGALCARVGATICPARSGLCPNNRQHTIVRVIMSLSLSLSLTLSLSLALSWVSHLCIYLWLSLLSARLVAPSLSLSLSLSLPFLMRRLASCRRCRKTLADN